MGEVEGVQPVLKGTTEDRGEYGKASSKVNGLVLLDALMVGLDMLFVLAALCLEYVPVCPLLCILKMRQSYGGMA